MNNEYAWVLIHYYSYEGFARPVEVFTQFPTYRQLSGYKISKPLYEWMAAKQDYDKPYMENVDGWCLLRMTLNGSK
jgi:hypothetical protein